MEYSAWDQALKNMQKKIEGKMAIQMCLIASSHPLTHRDFEVRRAPGYDHKYHVVRKHDGRWCQFNYENGKAEYSCGSFKV